MENEAWLGEAPQTSVSTGIDAATRHPYLRVLEVNPLAMATSKVLQHLYSLGTSSPDLPLYLYCLIENDVQEEYLTGLRGSELTRLVDFLEEALDFIPNTDDVSRRCLHKLQDICNHHKVLPTSYNVSGDLVRIGSHPVTSGGFSDVWEGVYNHKRVCIKYLRITQQNRQAFEKRFRKEAVMWRRLRHPNIVPLIGVTQDPLQFVSEWMPNGTLTEYLEKNPSANRIRLLLDVAEGLAFLHANHTTHGDLKGPNILIDNSGHARLTDFGLASVVRGVNSVLVTGVQGYSSRWAAPEVLKNGDKNAREADVFAFGMVVVEAFTGLHPFNEFTNFVTISKIIDGERPGRPQQQHLTDSIWDMTLGCWLEDPAQRPQMTTVMKILRECYRLHIANPHLSGLPPPKDGEPATSWAVDGEQGLVSRHAAGVSVYLTRCYTPRCLDEHPCYVYSRPKRGHSASHFPILAVEVPSPTVSIGWPDGPPPKILASLPEIEVKRQILICELVLMEQRYIKDLDFIEEVFIHPLQIADPPVIQGKVREYINEVFNKILELRACHRHLLEAMHTQRQEQDGIISRIGDTLLNVVTESRLAYSTYIGQLEGTERRLRKEMGDNEKFRIFLEQCSQHPDNVNGVGLRHWLNRPLEHLNKYPDILEAIRMGAAEGNPDTDYLEQAVGAVRNIQSAAKLEAFQAAMGDGPTGKFKWHDLVPEDVGNKIPEREARRQAIIFELIREEMTYVKDLAFIENMYVRKLRLVDPPIIPRERLETFIRDVFHNSGELYTHHGRLLGQLLKIQREEHPTIGSVAALVHRAVLNLKGSYLDYTSNYPIAMYRIDDEVASNPRFGAFVSRRVGHPGEHQVDMKDLINRPTSRLLRCELLLRNILKETPSGHTDLAVIPAILGVIESLRKEAEPRIASANQKVSLRRYHANLVFPYMTPTDMDLLDENRSLIHADRLWSASVDGPDPVQFFALLFDNYLVLTEPREKNGVTKYQIFVRPIPIDFLALERSQDPRVVTSTDGTQHFCLIYHAGRPDYDYSLFTESVYACSEWRDKVQKAIGLRKVSRVPNEIFLVNTLIPRPVEDGGPSPNNDWNFAGKVTCSAPFATLDGHDMVAIGCENGVWTASRHDPQSIKHALVLRKVTQCAVLDDFGIFLVLADGVLLGYLTEELLTPSPSGAASALRTSKNVGENEDVRSFTVGNLDGKTLVIYVARGSTAMFRVLEPVIERIQNTDAQRSLPESRIELRSQESKWFRVSSRFSRPHNFRIERYDVLFVKGRVAIPRPGGFEMVDPSDPKGGTFPQDCPRTRRLMQRHSWNGPVGILNLEKSGFLVCFAEGGLYVDGDGYPTHMGKVEWEIKVEKAIWHPPYILLFGERFIEIRHAETGRLVQVIPGDDIRCIWDGNGKNSSQDTSDGSWGDASPEGSKVHGVMNSGRGQHVFELVPKVPLPEPPALPSHAS